VGNVANTQGQAGLVMSDAADRLHEQLLVHRCQAGDGAAFEELVVRYGPRLRYFLRKLLGEASGAEDALQGVWMDAFRALPRLLDPGTFPAWIYRIARDRAYRELRRRRRWRPLEDGDLVDDDSQSEAFSTEDAARVHAAIDA